MNSPIRLAVVGAQRGKSFITAAQSFQDQIRLTAVCDINPVALENWHGTAGIRCYSDYEQVLNDPEIDAVCLATPMMLHARQAIEALEAGKHVLSEVTAACTLEECWDLVAAVERTGLTYMMAENYCFTRPVMMVQNMVEQGVFGEITYASGAYLHDCCGLMFTTEGELTWRGELRHSNIGNTYPTHSLGPIARWLGINDTDRLLHTATWQSKSPALAHYAKGHFSQREEYSRTDFWRHPDTSTTMIQTENGVLIDLRFDAVSARPHDTARYELQGTKASFATSTPRHHDANIWIEGRSVAGAKSTTRHWEPLMQYAEEFDHPLWREHLQDAQAAGHGGGDYFTLREFAGAIRENRPPLIDVYDAVTWSSITPLSALPVEQGNARIDVPDFKTGSVTEYSQAKVSLSEAR